MAQPRSIRTRYDPDLTRRSAVERGRALNLNRVLVPLSGASRGEQILPYASMITDWFHGELTLFHSLPPTHHVRGVLSSTINYPDAPHDRGTSLATSYLEEVISRLSPHGIHARWGLASGDPAPMIASRSVTSSIGLVAMAISARTRPHRFFAPGLLDHLWKRTTAPLLIVNPNHRTLNEASPAPPTKLILPYKDEATAAAFPYASAIAGTSRAEIIVCTKGTSHDRSEIDSIVENLNSDGIQADHQETMLQYSEAVAEIQSNNPGSWIVVGSRMRSGFTRAVFGSLADILARDASGPILIVPERRIRRRRERAARALTRELATSN